MLRRFTSPAAQTTAVWGLQIDIQYHHRRRRTSLSKIAALVFLLITLCSAQLGGALSLRDEGMNRVLLSGRRLIGLGSSPPTCRSKCGRCLPCKPIQVTIEPGLSIPLEYYPEAWRCTCGKKLFNP